MNSDQSACWGLVNRKERWGLSWRGVSVVAVIATSICWGWFAFIYPFLAVTERVETRLLVVEGWIPQFAINAAASEFRSGPYHRVFTTGGPIHGAGGFAEDYSTAASLGAERLTRAGLKRDQVQMVPSQISARDRTYSSAIALRDWLVQNAVTVTAINIVTEDVHARRTRLLFQKAFGDGVKVGVIAVPSPDYDPAQWWRSSEGVRGVLGETIAYLYARLIFRPTD